MSTRHSWRPALTPPWVLVSTRTALLAAAVPLTRLTVTDVGLAKLDARVGATASSCRIGAKCLAAWLRRVTDSWETLCVRFRQLSGARPSMAECVQKHDAFLTTRIQAAALRITLKGDWQGGHNSRAREHGQNRSVRPSGQRQPGGQPARRGREERCAGEDVESDGSAREDGESGKKRKPAGRCAWPEKPRLPPDKFKEFQAECRKRCSNTCFAFLVGTCREPSCGRSHEAPAVFEEVKKKFL